jgi:hypothetical protein
MYAVSEGLMSLAHDKRPEANRHIELRLYALQRYTRRIYEVVVSLFALAENGLGTD